MPSRASLSSIVSGEQSAAMPDADRDAFVAAMAQAVTGVSVVTTDGPAGPLGATVSAVASVSAEPPLIVACIKRTSAITRAIHTNRIFCINLLAADQHPLSDRFAGRSGAERSFDAGEGTWEVTASGALRLANAAASFDCALWAAHEAGSHTMFLGRVVGVTSGGHAALAYSQRRYGRSVPLVQPDPAPRA
jgi:flavin reductase